MGNEITKILESLAGTYQPDEAVPVDERVAAYWWGQAIDEEVAYAIGMASLVSDDPVARILYEFSCAGDMAGQGQVTQLAAWCAGMAAEAAFTGSRFRKERLKGYQCRWGRQAGRDGAALAMWGDDIRDEMPGVNARATKYGCRDESYLRVRDYVEAEAKELIFRFRRDVEMGVRGRFDPDFRARWERKTGKLWLRN